MSRANPILIIEALDEQPMQALAKAFALRLKPQDVVTLEGDLGSGKTTFARALITALSPAEVEVTSPTFSLMQPYDVKLADGSAERLWHLDLYRIEDAAELAALGLEELWPHIALIEWPSIAAGVLPQERLNITFNFAAEGRTLAFYGNDAWRQRLKALI